MGGAGNSPKRPLAAASAPSGSLGALEPPLGLCAKPWRAPCLPRRSNCCISDAPECSSVTNKAH
eukprot:5053654-Lingulodinium_polyedra.AAC.1